MPILVREGGVLQAPLHGAAAQGQQSLMALCALQAVATFDADGDGKVDANDVFGMLDKNRDGTIDAGRLPTRDIKRLQRESRFFRKSFTRSSDWI